MGMFSREQTKSYALGQMCFLLCTPGIEANSGYREGAGTEIGTGLRS